MVSITKTDGRYNMQAQVLKTIEKEWLSTSNFFTFPKNEIDYQDKVELMDYLLEQDYPDDHPIFILINLLGEMIDRYEIEHFPEVRKLEKLTGN